jgi:uncharacterized damage-inducible protein DinB
MIDLIRELFQYQAWADSQLIAAIKAHTPAAEDEELRKSLHHIVLVQRFFLHMCAGEAFNFEKEMAVPSAFDEVERLFSAIPEHAGRVLTGLSPGTLSNVLDRPPLDAMRPTVQTALTQAVLHSQHHRGQVASRLRSLGGTPPTVDYILWKKDRP